MKPFVRVKYTGPPCALAGYGTVETGTEISLRWRDWQYMKQQSGGDEVPEFELLSEDDESKDTVHPSEQEEALKQAGLKEGLPEVPVVEVNELTEEEKALAEEAAKLAENKEEPIKQVDSYEELTVKELKEQLTARGVEFPSGALKADLVALMELDDATSPDKQ